MSANSSKSYDGDVSNISPLRFGVSKKQQRSGHMKPGNTDLGEAVKIELNVKSKPVSCQHSSSATASSEESPRSNRTWTVESPRPSPTLNLSLTVDSENADDEQKINELSSMLKRTLSSNSQNRVSNNANQLVRFGKTLLLTDSTSSPPIGGAGKTQRH